MTSSAATGRALITGASAGLGADMARILASRGWGLVLTARSVGRLEDLADELRTAHGVSVDVVPADLGALDAGKVAGSALHQAAFDCDLLVNNAGFGQWGPYTDLDTDEELSMIRLNVESLTALTRWFLPGMIARGRGRILNVASTASFFSGPLMTTYYATKAYVLSYSEALAEELRGTGVTVTCLCPGVTRTEFQARAGMEDAGILFVGAMDSVTVARAGIDAALAGRPLVIPGLINKLYTFAPRFLPRRLLPKLVRRFQAGRAP